MGTERQTYCSCGNLSDHIIARRTTLDEKTILFYSDGSVSGAMGFGIYGREPRNPGLRDVYLQASWLLADEVCLYNSWEVKKALKVARRAVQQVSLAPLVYFRRVMGGARFHSTGKVVREVG